MDAKAKFVDVVLIEPGLIRRSFGDTAAHGVGATGSNTGPYADFNSAVAKATEEVYTQGPLAKLGGGPETVARAIERAISSRRPRTRYKVTPSARMALASRSLMTDRMWDGAMRSNFPQPGR